MKNQEVIQVHCIFVAGNEAVEIGPSPKFAIVSNANSHLSLSLSFHSKLCLIIQAFGIETALVLSVDPPNKIYFTLLINRN